MEIREIIDYNGTGMWSGEAVRARYAEYARQHKISPLLPLEPRISEHRTRRWIYPVMGQVIEGIEQGDEACIDLGVDFIEVNTGFPFGRILKSNTARALRRAPLNTQHVQRIRKRVTGMLLDENLARIS